MIPKGSPKPEGEYELSVETEFHANPNDDDEGCSHTSQCAHCRHSTKHDEGLYVGGRKVESGTPFHGFYNAVVEVW